MIVVKSFGWVLYLVGGLAVFLIDIVSSMWLYNAHGIGWVILAWITMLPLVVIPFLAGYGVAFLIAAAITLMGMFMADVE